MPPDHYAALGVAPDADITVIKRRYRQLVRAHHPDTLALEQRAQAHQKMLALNAAWGVLSSPAERARYDRSRQSQTALPRSSFRADEIVIHPPRSQGSWNEVAPKNTPKTATSAKSATTSRSATTASNATASNAKAANAKAANAKAANAKAANAKAANAKAANATSSTRSQNRDAPRNSPRARPVDNSGSRKPTPSRLLSMVFEAAELYFFHGRAAEAISLCQSVLHSDANHAEAYALLGDIYEDQGRRDTAAQMYERAAQSQPSHAIYARKRDALNAELRGEKPAANATKSAVSNGAPDIRYQSDRSIFDDEPTTSTRSHSGDEYGGREYGGRNFAEEARSRAWFGLALVGLAVAFAFLAGARAASVALGRAPFSWLPAAPIAPDALFCLVLASVSLGAALPMLGLARRFALLDKNNAHALAPTMLIVALIGVSWSPLAPLFALILSVWYRRWNGGVWCVLLLSLVASSALSLRVPHLASDAIVWWSGRVALPSLLAGWALGALGSLD